MNIAATCARAPANKEYLWEEENVFVWSEGLAKAKPK